MNIPCVKRVAWGVTGLVVVQPAFTAIQFDHLTRIAPALILGSGLHLSAISRMWLKEKWVRTLSYFFSDANIDTAEVQTRYAKHALRVDNIVCGYVILDDPLNHHPWLCTWIHGVCVLCDPGLHTHLKAVCLGVLYDRDGLLLKFPMGFRIDDKAEGQRMPWQRGKPWEYKPKYLWAAEILEWALGLGFPGSVVLADAWDGIGPFVTALTRLTWSSVLEIRAHDTVKTPCKTPKLTPTGRLATPQDDAAKLPEFFSSLSPVTRCGFKRDRETGTDVSGRDHLKIATIRLTSITGKHRLVERIDPTTQSTTSLLTNHLPWEAPQIVSAYRCRWVLEEFFRHAKQGTAMEGAMLRSEPGVTRAFCLVFWRDFLLHQENRAPGPAGK